MDSIRNWRRPSIKNRRQSSKEEEDEGGGLVNKSKLMSVWQSMKYGKTFWSLDSKSSFSATSPVWLMGQCYHRKLRRTIDPQQCSLTTTRQVHTLSENDAGMEAFNADFSSRLWFTYRREFEKFRGTSITTDCGWGCMIRSGQMLLANALILHHLCRQWTWKDQDRHVVTAVDFNDEFVHRNIVRLFGDNSMETVSPLSIHALMSVARTALNRHPGDWFGPSATAHLLKAVLNKSGPKHQMLTNITAYVAKDCTVYAGDVLDLCSGNNESQSSTDSLNMDEYSLLDPEEIRGCGIDTIKSYALEESSNSSTWTPVLILVPIKIGRDQKLNQIYAPCIKALLATDTCVGIIGGRPRHSLYFVGFQDDNLIHLDPHLVQDHLDVFKRDFDLTSFHCKTPRKMSISRMDPSCCFGFLLSTRKQFDGWCELTKEIAMPPQATTSNGGVTYPLFSISSGKSSDNKSPDEVLSQIDQLESIDESGIDANLVIPPCDEDEFVFL